MIHRHCSNSSPCVIAAKANSGLGERILPLNQQIVCVFTGSKGTFSELWKGRNFRGGGVFPFSLAYYCETNDLSFWSAPFMEYCYFQSLVSLPLHLKFWGEFCIGRENSGPESAEFDWVFWKWEQTVTRAIGLIGACMLDPDRPVSWGRWELSVRCCMRIN